MSLPSHSVRWQFYCCLDNKLDRSATNICRQTNAGAPLVKMLDNINLTDIWRTLNSSVRDFTFYSNPHNSCWRIDYFFIPPQIIGQATACNIGSIHISDHAPVYLELVMSETILGRQRWRFPSYLLMIRNF